MWSRRGRCRTKEMAIGKGREGKEGKEKENKGKLSIGARSCYCVGKEDMCTESSRWRKRKMKT